MYHYCLQGLRRAWQQDSGVGSLPGPVLPPRRPRRVDDLHQQPELLRNWSIFDSKLELLLVRMPNSEPHDGEAILGHPGAYLPKNMLFAIVKELNWAMNIRIFSAEQQHRKANHACSWILPVSRWPQLRPATQNAWRHAGPSMLSSGLGLVRLIEDGLNSKLVK